MKFKLITRVKCVGEQLKGGKAIDIASHKAVKDKTLCLYIAYWYTLKENCIESKINYIDFSVACRSTI